MVLVAEKFVFHAEEFWDTFNGFVLSDTNKAGVIKNVMPTSVLLTAGSLRLYVAKNIQPFKN